MAKKSSKPPTDVPVAADEAEVEALARSAPAPAVEPTTTLLPTVKQAEADASISANENRGAAAYEIYGLDANWRSWDGRPMPSWANLSDAVRGHWNAVHDYYTNRR